VENEPPELFHGKQARRIGIETVIKKFWIA
jgi:hypothetical protein